MTVTKKIVTIPAVWSHYCILTLQDEIGKLDGVKDVRVDLVAKKARFIWDEPATWDQIADKLRQIGYPASE